MLLTVLTSPGMTHRKTTHILESPDGKRLVIRYRPMYIYLDCAHYRQSIIPKIAVPLYPAANLLSGVPEEAISIRETYMGHGTLLEDFVSLLKIYALICAVSITCLVAEILDPKRFVRVSFSTQRLFEVNRIRQKLRGK